jgi:hypothetical protein
MSGQVADTQRRIELEDNFDPDVDFFLPLQLYGNKTGTNVNQWYRNAHLDGDH